MMLRLALTILLFAPTVSAEPEVLGTKHPKAFFFRKSEGFARAGHMPYERWSDDFSRLQGIIGKCLDEEIPGTMRRNPDFFRRFKKEHPDQIVLLHFNGNANDPRFCGDRYFPGHWIHREATTITADVPAETGETVIQVASTRGFKTDTGRYQNANDDIALFGISPDGTHDWSRCEQVQLIAVDHEAGAIRVRRGCYGTKPLAFAADASRAAAHAVEGPWGKNNNLLWFYNFADHCPRDPAGKTASDVLVDHFAEWFGPGGPLEGLDGVEFDVMHHVTRGDTTGDGRLDHGIINRHNTYGSGMIAFARQLRARMGDDFIIQGDGALGSGGLRSQRAFHILNGIESEGWPNLHDWDFDDWSGGLNRHTFWNANAHPPAFSYINHKWNEAVPGEPGARRRPDLPFSRHRLALAGAVLTDSVITFAFVPPRDGKHSIAIWDELVAGTDNRTAWLGNPKGPSIHLATRRPDLCSGMDLARSVGGNVEAATTKHGVTVKPRSEPSTGPLRFHLSDLPARGPDLVVSVTMRGDHPAHWPREMARSARIGVSSGIRSLVSSTPRLTGMRLRNKDAQPIDTQSGASVRYQRERKIGGVPMDAIAVHPPYKAAKGSVHWASDIRLDRESDLRFAIGMGPLSPQRSDGVVFEIHLAEIDNGHPGRFQRVFQTTSKAHEWIEQSVSLKPWRGKHVRLKFVADCGPNHHATTDHAYWGKVRLVPAGRKESELTTPKSHMTWLNENAFTSTFYFRDIKTDKVDLDFEFESSAPVTIERLTMHAAPDLMMREFENGLVLANPSHRSQAFDLGKLTPGRTFRRIQGTPKQDPETNNGKPARNIITLGERDALFLRR